MKLYYALRFDYACCSYLVNCILSLNERAQIVSFEFRDCYLLPGAKNSKVISVEKSVAIKGAAENALNYCDFESLLNSQRQYL